MKRGRRFLLFFVLIALTTIVTAGITTADTASEETNEDMFAPLVEAETDSASQEPTEALAELLEAEPIPFWQRPDYIVEARDVVRITLEGESLPKTGLEKVEGKHVVSPEGFVTLGKYGRVSLEGLTPAECAEGVRFHLAKQVDDGGFEVSVDMIACNSKYYKVVFLSDFGTRQEMQFPYERSDWTVSDAIRQLNAENELALPEEVGDSILVLRSDTSGKPVKTFSLDFSRTAQADRDDTHDESTFNIVLQSGDTILLKQNFRGEDIRPDAGIVGISSYTGAVDAESLAASPAADNDANWPDEEYVFTKRNGLLVPRRVPTKNHSDNRHGSNEPVLAPELTFEAESAEPMEKTASEFSGKNSDEEKAAGSDDSPSTLDRIRSVIGRPEVKKTAKSVYFDMQKSHFVFVDSGIAFSSDEPCAIQTFLASLVPDCHVSFVYRFNKEIEPMTIGLWVILVGEEQIVEQLHAVLKEIADGATKKAE